MHINKTNNKIYVGITKQKLENRWKKGGTYKRCPRFYPAIKKYGWDGFEHIVYASNLTKSEAEQTEIFLIKELKTQNKMFGYNVADGGNLPLTHNEYVRKKISDSVSGEKHPCFGKHLSEETRRKISLSEKGAKKPSISLLKSIPVICVETNERYNSAKEAAAKTGINRTGINQVLKNKRNHAGGYHWQYAT